MLGIFFVLSDVTPDYQAATPTDIKLKKERADKNECLHLFTIIYYNSLKINTTIN